MIDGKAVSPHQTVCRPHPAQHSPELLIFPGDSCNLSEEPDPKPSDPFFNSFVFLIADFQFIVHFRNRLHSVFTRYLPALLYMRFCKAIMRLLHNLYYH